MYFDVNERNLKLSGGVWSSLPSCADLSDDNNCVRIGLVPTTQPPPTSGNTWIYLRIYFEIDELWSYPHRRS